MDGFAKKYAIKSDGSACAENVIIDSDLRITVITPELIRIEKGSFCDLPTQTVLFRNLGKVDFSFKNTSNRINASFAFRNAANCRASGSATDVLLPTLKTGI